MFSLLRKKAVSSTEAVDIIEQIVYEYVKPYGFRKHGRTLHRFVDGDISQVIHFQNGCPSKGVRDVLWVNLGIRVPECAERKWAVAEPLKRYYHEYECTIRTRLGLLVDRNDSFYRLKKNPHVIGNDIVNRLQKYVMPVFDDLADRDALLKHRAAYAHFDQMGNDMLLLDETMIWGRKGDIDKASQSFNAYYQQALAQYRHDLEHGSKTYLRKGERMVYRNAQTGKTETVTATKNGYVTTYDANAAHITYLQKLAAELGIPLCNS